MNIAALKAELIAGHPNTGAYNVDAVFAMDQLNAVNRPVEAVAIERLLRFLVLENTHKSDDGTDTQDRAIWTRMKDVNALAVTPIDAIANPWGSIAIGTVTEIQIIKTKQLLEFFTLSAQGNLEVDLTESNFVVYLAGARAAGCMSTAQETALKALADNKQSRAQELNLGIIKHGHVLEARL